VFCFEANWYGMKIDLQNIKHTLSNMFKDNDCQVTNMWNVFKETISLTGLSVLGPEFKWMAFAFVSNKMTR
jgi:hypothetical protein